MYYQRNEAACNTIHELTFCIYGGSQDTHLENKCAFPFTMHFNGCETSSGSLS